MCRPMSTHIVDGVSKGSVHVTDIDKGFVLYLVWMKRVAMAKTMCVGLAFNRQPVFADYDFKLHNKSFHGFSAAKVSAAQSSLVRQYFNKPRAIGRLRFNHARPSCLVVVYYVTGFALPGPNAYSIRQLRSASKKRPFRQISAAAGKGRCRRPCLPSHPAEKLLRLDNRHSSR
jgi:hypothetical protein